MPLNDFTSEKCPAAALAKHVVYCAVYLEVRWSVWFEFQITVVVKRF
jgi:hypothetical protein